MYILPPAGDNGETRHDAALNLLVVRRIALVRVIQPVVLVLCLTAETFTEADICSAVVILTDIDPIIVGSAVRSPSMAGVIHN